MLLVLKGQTKFPTTMIALQVFVQDKFMTFISESYWSESEKWSSQLIFQFMESERRSLKKSGLQQDSHPWPPRYRCDALPTELWSHTLGARSIYWVHISHEEWNGVKYIWNNSYLNSGCRWKWRISSQLVFQFNELERRSLKQSGLQRDSNPWPPRCRCDAPPTELWSHTFGARSIYGVHISCEEWNGVKYVCNNSYLNCFWPTSNSRSAMLFVCRIARLREC